MCTSQFTCQLVVLQRVTVVQFGVDNKGSNGTGSFRIMARIDTTQFTFECQNSTIRHEVKE